MKKEKSPQQTVVPHTPGPWHISTDTAGIRRIGKILNPLAMIYLPEMRPGMHSDLEAQANANLISAAPDLLDALTKLANTIRGIQEDYASLTADTELPERESIDRRSFYRAEINKQIDVIDQQLETAEAAMRKARGEATEVTIV